MNIFLRFLIYILTGPCLIGIIFFVLRYWIRRNAKVARWISPAQRHLLVLSAALVVVFIPIGFIHTLFDQVLWLITTAAGCWALYRIMKMGNEP